MHVAVGVLSVRLEPDIQPRQQHAILLCILPVKIYCGMLFLAYFYSSKLCCISLCTFKRAYFAQANLHMQHITLVYGQSRPAYSSSYTQHSPHVMFAPRPSPFSKVLTPASVINMYKRRRPGTKASTIMCDSAGTPP